MKKNKIDYYKDALRKYAVFDGRANRPEYWYFVLFNALAGIIIGVVGAILHDRSAISNLYNLAVLVPSIAIATRRLHDIGKSGWWQLLVLIPIIGWVWIIVLLATKSDVGANKYGAHSK